MSHQIISKFPRKVNRMNEHDIDNLICIIIGGVLITAVILIYLFTHTQEEPIPELTAYEIPERVVVFEETGTIESEAEPVKHLTDEDIMAMVVSAESKGEEMVGKVAVASVILNRCDYYGETVETVVNKPNQFASYENEKPSDECYRAVEIAQAHRDLFPATMMWFARDGYHKNDKLEDYLPIGSHYFSILKAE